MAQIAPYIFPQFFDNNGDPLNGGLIYAYAAGTTTPQDTYSNAAGTSANTNPIVLSSSGRTKVFLQNLAYDFVIKNSAGETIDSISGVGSAAISGGASFIDTISELRALASGAFNYVEVGGYSTKGDGGGGLFYWDATETAADMGINIQPNSLPAAGRWVREYSGEVNVKWFGAKGDTATDDLTAIAAANTYVASLTNGGTLYFPESSGGYLVTSNPSFNAKTFVRMESGAYFTSAGVAITFGGGFDAALKTAFSATVGAVSFAPGREVPLEWFGTMARASVNLASVSTTLVIGSSASVPSTLDFAAAAPNVMVRLPEGGSFNIASGQTLTIPQPEAGKYQIKYGDGTLLLTKAKRVFTEWWGAAADGATDSGSAIQEATDCASGIIVDFQPGVYNSSIALTVPTSNITWQGGSADATRIKDTGNAFRDFITVVDGNNEWAKIRGLGLVGGSFLAGKARYVLAADNFNAGCEVSDCLIRDGVGLVKITNGYLGRFSHNVLVGTTPSATAAGITHSEWLEVYGDEHAPVELRVFNNSEIDHNYLLRVGSEESSGVKGYAACIIDGAGLSVHNLGIENSSTYNSGGTDYVLSLKKTLVLHNFIGNVNAYFENNSPDENLVYTSGISHTTIQDSQSYNCAIGGAMFNNGGLGPLKVIGGKCWRINCPSLSTMPTSGATNQEGVYFERFSMISGRRLTDPAINSETDNVFDSFGSYSVLGMIDGVSPTYTPNRLFIPKILDGYAVTNSSDSDGVYILVTGGIFFNEAGQTVQNKHYCADGATLVVNKLRPTTVSNYYRVFVGEAGQVYLTASASPYTTGYGNWIASFATDGAGAITGLAVNARLAYNGRYIPNTTRVEAQGTAAPVSGYWAVGDRIVNTAPGATGATLDLVCVTAGTPGTWVDPYTYILGKSGGQTLIGGTGASENLTLQSTSSGTKGKVRLGAAATSAYDEVNDRLGIGTASPSTQLELSKSVDGGSVKATITNTFTSAGSLDELVGIDFLFGTALAASLDVVKEEDFTSAGNRTAAYVFSVRKDGTTTEVLRISGNNNTVQISNADLILRTKTPASAAAAGTAGMIAWDTNYIYICTAANTWKRVAIATW